MSPVRAAAALAAAALSVGTPTLFAQGFEGTLHARAVTISQQKLAEMGLTTPDAVLALSVDSLVAGPAHQEGVVHVASTYYVEPGKILLLSATPDSSDAANYIIMDINAGVMDIVVPQRKAYIEWTAADAKKLKTGQPNADSTTSAVKITPMHTSAVVNGIHCEMYRAETAQEVVIGCMSAEHRNVADALAKLTDGMKKLGGAEAGGPSPEARLTKFGLPIRLVSLPIADGRVAGDFDIEEFVAISPGAIAPGRFTIPADYTKTTAGDLMTRMKQQ